MLTMTCLSKRCIQHSRISWVEFHPLCFVIVEPVLSMEVSKKCMLVWKACAMRVVLMHTLRCIEQYFLAGRELPKAAQRRAANQDNSWATRTILVRHLGHRHTAIFLQTGGILFVACHKVDFDPDAGRYQLRKDWWQSPMRIEQPLVGQANSIAVCHA
eukprot:1126636-Amphidinium_carterae.1